MAQETSVDTFLVSHGFTADPFELTNADAEPLLSEYFVPPPFFTSVLGDPKHPRPVAVFAPRGTGKTAQRLSVEDTSRQNRDFLCVTYDDFGVSTRTALDKVDLDYHRRQLIIRITVAILAHLEDESNTTIDALSKHQRQVLLHCARTYLGSLSQQEYSVALSSVKTWKDKSAETWSKYGGVVANVVNALLKKAKLEDLAIPSEIAASFAREDSQQYLFEQLLLIAQSLGYHSTYVLVDKVDELVPTSQDAQASWRLVQDLLVNLPFLETQGVGFKFFLWDQVRTHFIDGGGRPDRVLSHQLEWTVDDLRRILRRRLSAYSEGRVNSLEELFQPDVGLDVETLVVELAAHSPRDMIRLCKAVLDEGIRSGLTTGGVGRKQVLDGIRAFSREYADIVCGGRLPELRKIGSVTFTINKLASDVFNVSENAARSRVQKWQDAGLVRKVDERPNRVNRPLHVYSIADPRVAVACCEGLDLDLVLDNYLIVCNNCSALQVVGDNEFRCTECDQVQALADAKSLWQAAAR